MSELTDGDFANFSALIFYCGVIRACEFFGKEWWRVRRGTPLRNACRLARLANVKQVNVHEAKTELSRLLELVEAGERVIIARAGRPVAVLIAYQPSVRKRKLGQFRGQGTIPDDFDELPPELAGAFEGDEE